MSVKGILTILGVLVFTYFYPRILVGALGESNPWTSYLYMYGFGLIVFLIGITLILKTGACVLGRGHDSYWFKVLIGGFIFFASAHAMWIVLALSVPVKGAS